MTRDFTTKTPAELAEARESRRIWADVRRDNAKWDRLVRSNARLGLYFHTLENPDINPWSECDFTPCPPWCTRHGGSAA